MKKRTRPSEGGINQLSKLFWVGSATECREQFEIHHFDYIVSVDFAPDEGYKGAEKRHFQMYDLSSLRDKYKVEQTRQTMIHVVNLILEATGRGKTVFLHCQVGQSRSISIAIAYIMVAFGKSAIEAQRYVFYHRHISRVKRELLEIAIGVAQKSVNAGENRIVDEAFEISGEEDVKTEDYIVAKIASFPWRY